MGCGGIYKIGLFKMQSRVFPGPELVAREGLLRRYKMLTKNEYLTDLAIIIISLQLFYF